MPAPATTTLGIDFGTTNTVVSVRGDDGQADLVRFAFENDRFTPFRSCLSFGADEGGPRGRVVEAGPWAIDAYLEDPGATRFIQSFKSFAASATFSETTILGRRYRFEDLLSTFLLRVRAHAAAAMAAMPRRLIVGRPVRFAGAYPDPALALQRYEIAFRRLGVTEIYYAHEPVAAAFFFARGLDADATVLVGDFGGGTSDFSILRFDPNAEVTPLGHAGIGIAGDVFDFRIIDRAIAPLLGKGDSYRIMGKPLPVPPEYYSGFARWHLLSLMRTPRTLRAIAEVARTAQHPERLRHLITLIEDGLGYALYQAVSTAKAELSRADATTLHFRHNDFVVERTIRRPEFEEWIGADLARMAVTVDQALTKAEIARDAVDRVFLTGGTALVPAVRRLFEDRFGADRLVGGGEFVSVAEGLALMGAL
jgi:hypothetical chaperone protein